MLPIRDAALVAAMGFIVAARKRPEPALTWQQPLFEDELEAGLKTGARAALLFPNARDRLRAYRSELESRYGAQPDNGLVFQVLGTAGPLWRHDGTPAAWDVDAYKRWTARTWRPARQRAAKAPDVATGFYDLRHSAISMALHSTLVRTPHGLDLHNLAAWAGQLDVSRPRAVATLPLDSHSADRPVPGA